MAALAYRATEESIRRDFDATDTWKVVYEGFAQPGHYDDNGSAVWKICKYIWVGAQNVAIAWADGNTNYDKIWDDRDTAYTYT